MTPWLSNKFRWLSLIATWAVVCLHSRTDRWVPDVCDWASSIQVAFRSYLNFAVPLFFLINGFHFISSYNKYKYLGLLLRKIKSLYVPAVIWAFMTTLLCLPIRLFTGNGIPSIRRPIGILLLWLSEMGAENVQFWYVRSLLYMFLLAPIVMLVLRFRIATYIIIIFLVVCGLPIKEEGYLKLMHINTTILFFILGAFVAANTKLRDVICTKMSRGGVMAIIGLLFNFIPYPYLTILGQIMVLWGLYDVIDSRSKIPEMPSRFNVLFFVYGLHLIVICWAGGVLKLTLGTSPIARTISYIVLDMTFWLDVLIANLVLKYSPRLYVVLAGGRVT